MVNKPAVVFWDKSLMSDNRDQYIYGICSGTSVNPTGFYFKWMGYLKEVSLEKSLYLDSEWKIIWLSKKLTMSQLDTIIAKGFIPGITPTLKSPNPK